MLIVRDRHGATTDAMMPDLEAATIARVLQPVVAKDALLVSDGSAAYDRFADANGLLHIKLVSSKRETPTAAMAPERQCLHQPP